MAGDDKIDQASGKAKQAAGKVTGDEQLEREGKAQHDVSRAKESVEDAGHKIKEATKDALGGNESDADDDKK